MERSKIISRKTKRKIDFINSIFGSDKDYIGICEKIDFDDFKTEGFDFCKDCKINTPQDYKLCKLLKTKNDKNKKNR